MKVLLATDGSRCSQHAIERALALLPADAAYTVVAVTPAPTMLVDYGIGMMPAPLSTMLVDAPEQLAPVALDNARKLLAARGVEADYVDRMGEPVHEIVAIATERQPDLVVVGTHGRGALGRMVLGSVSTALLQAWPGAIMVVPPGHEEAPGR